MAYIIDNQNNYIINVLIVTPPKRTKHRIRKKQGQKSVLKNKDVFLYQDDLNGCGDYIESNFSDPNKPLYRWTKNPSTERDLIPQRYLLEDAGDDLDMGATVEERVERNTVSMYVSEEASIKKYNNVISALTTKDKKQDNDPSSGHKSSFIDRCGTYVSKFNLTSKDAVVSQANNSGHVNVILKRGFDFDRCLDKDFGTKKILKDEEQMGTNE